MWWLTKLVLEARDRIFSKEAEIFIFVSLLFKLWPIESLVDVDWEEGVEEKFKGSVGNAVEIVGSKVGEEWVLNMGRGKVKEVLGEEVEGESIESIFKRMMNWKQNIGADR